MRWITRPLFFGGLFLVALLVNVFVHEIGHAVVVAVHGGWENNAVYFGITSYDEPFVMNDLFSWIVEQGWTAENLADVDSLRTLFIHWAESSTTFRLGFMGGWGGQLIVALLVWLVTRLRFVREGIGQYSRLFWGAYAIAAFAWLGGLWIFRGLRPTVSSDDTVLWNVLLGGNTASIIAFWFVALACIGIAIWLGRSVGAWMFSSLSLSEADGRRLGMVWAGTVAGASFSQMLPSPIDFVAIFLIVTGVPTFFVMRRLGDPAGMKIQPIAWFGMLFSLAFLIMLIMTGTGLVVNSAGIDANQYRALQAYHCEQTDCLPEPYKALFEQP